MKTDPLARLQNRLLTESALVLPGVRDVRDLTKRLRSRLNKAFRDEILDADYQYLIKHKPGIVEIPNVGPQKVIAVWGGVEVNFNRDPAIPHFRRVDGAWFDFHIQLRPYAGKQSEHQGLLELLGYGYEIRFPPELGCHVRWLRFDLNPPGHDNEQREIRAHFHPGDDDLQAPSAVLHPEEALELLLSDLLHLPAKRRKSASDDAGR